MRAPWSWRSQPPQLWGHWWAIQVTAFCFSSPNGLTPLSVHRRLFSGSNLSSFTYRSQLLSPSWKPFYHQKPEEIPLTAYVVSPIKWILMHYLIWPWDWFYVDKRIDNISSIFSNNEKISAHRSWVTKSYWCNQWGAQRESSVQNRSLRSVLSHTFGVWAKSRISLKGLGLNKLISPHVQHGALPGTAVDLGVHLLK